MILALVVTSFSLPAAGLQAQPLPENFAGCQGGCDAGDRNLDAESEDLARGTRYYNRGLKKLERREFTKAAKNFQKAVDTIPTNAAYNYMAGSSFYFAGDHEAAKIYLTKALAAEGDEAIEPGQREIAEGILRKIAQE
ncbi:hypothetical protein [Parasphingorhabdus sp.]